MSRFFGFLKNIQNFGALEIKNSILQSKNIINFLENLVIYFLT